MSSKKAMAMWGVEQLTRMGKEIPEGTKKACGSPLNLGIAIASGNKKPAKKQK